MMNQYAIKTTINRNESRKIFSSSGTIERDAESFERGFASLGGWRLSL
jgi:hypothetical protein